MQVFLAELDRVEQFKAPVLISDADLSLRLMRDDEDDYAQMSAWLSDPRVLEFYEGRDSPYSIEDVREQYSPRLMAAEGVTPCFIEYDKAAIGYVQFYPMEEINVWGLDQFIGVPELWNRGLGTRVVRLMVDYLFSTRGAVKCVLDPQAVNERAIRCYEKAGFRKVRLLPASELHEGEYRDCWLMEALR